MRLTEDHELGWQEAGHVTPALDGMHLGRDPGDAFRTRPAEGDVHAAGESGDAFQDFQVAALGFDLSDVCPGGARVEAEAFVKDGGSGGPSDEWRPGDT